MRKTKTKSTTKYKYFIYSLELQNNKRYIGITRRPRKRLQEHIKAKSNFVKDYLPINHFGFTCLGEITNGEALFIENLLTMDYVMRFGIKDIAGGLMVGEFWRREAIFYALMNKLL